MMTIKIYNTLTRQKEPFETIQPGVVSMYVCGPTVYDKAHVGHAMSSLVFDIIRRYLEYRGYEFNHVMNYTDVDDKVIIRANQLGVDPIRLADGYIHEYDQHLEDFNILPATVNPRATEEIHQIVSMIRDLGENDYAYEVDGDVYFRVTRDDDYGKLSRRQLEDMQAGARIDIDQRKENPMDFALWKASKPGEPAWESPWGEGRPGWHIECSAMSMHHLGDQIDIHGGGNDLIFPHHENEIAQTESITGKSFARYWVHNGMMQLSGEKMSKSLGNLVTVEEFLNEYEGDVLRMMVLNSSYRRPLTFSDEVVSQAERALERLRSVLRPLHSNRIEVSAVATQNLQGQVEATRKGFEETMDDDFNTAGALGHLFDLVRAINQGKDSNASDEVILKAQGELSNMMSILGLHPESTAVKGGEADPFIDLLVELRSELRQQKQWALTDKIRDQLSEHGVLIEDSPDGTTWRWK
jgi:cysteinyl-tRNA synthetase